MLTTPLTLDTTSVGAPAGEPAVAGPAGVPDGGESFADQLALAQAALPTGQNLAAGSLPLQTLALGPQLEVITSPTGSPDGDSLAEFARAQGLDDEVVAWLFSDAAQASTLAVLPGAAGAMVLPAAVGAVPVAEGVPSALTGSLPSGLALPASPFTGATLPGLTPPTGPIGAAGSAAPALLTAQPPVPADADLAATLNIAPGTASWLQQQSARFAAGDMPADGADPTQAVNTTLTSSLLPALVASARGIRPDARTDTFKLPNAGNSVPMEILSLEVEAGLETLWDEPAASGSGSGNTTGSHLGSGSGSTAGTPTPSPSTAPALADDGAPASTAAQRAAGYQELSQRLGEALAQRVIAQVERGNWEIRLLLRPARLGEVEIDLSLRSGALDAAFRASNPVTRDLLNDGLPRLREVLADAGMDIAGLNVGSGRSQHTGGNPTPRHARAPGGDEGTDRSVTAAAAPASTHRLRGAGESGWDVLV